jgi:hypothetical protein
MDLRVGTSDLNGIRLASRGVLRQGPGHVNAKDDRKDDWKDDC